MTSGAREALADVLGKLYSEARREWVRDYHAEIANLRALVAEKKAELSELKAQSAELIAETQRLVAITLASAVIERGATPTELAKAHFRRALALSASKRDDEAANDLKVALENAPGDAGIIRAQKELDERRRVRLAKQRAAYSKMFST